MNTVKPLRIEIATETTYEYYWENVCLMQSSSAPEDLKIKRRTTKWNWNQYLLDFI